MDYHLPIYQYEERLMKAIQQDYSYTAEEHLSLVDEGKIKRNIGYKWEQVEAKPPYSDPDTKQVIFNESYLTFLWCFIYFSTMLYERHIVKMHNKNKRVIVDYRNDPLLVRADEIFKWGLSLKSRYSEWSGVFPPESANPEECMWGEKVTIIWVRAVSFMFFHEFSHMTCDHYLTKDNFDNLEMEKEADNVACDTVMSAMLNFPACGSGCKLGVILAVVSNLFFVESYTRIYQNGRHPDLDDRIRYMLERSKVNEDDNKGYFYYMVSTLCVLAFNSYDFPYQLDFEYITEDEYFNDVLRNFDALKEHIRSL